MCDIAAGVRDTAAFRARSLLRRGFEDADFCEDVDVDVDVDVDGEASASLTTGSVFCASRSGILCSDDEVGACGCCECCGVFRPGMAAAMEVSGVPAFRGGNGVESV